MDDRHNTDANEMNTETAENYSEFFGTSRDVVERYCHCVICGSNLHFTHVTDFSRNMTQETARCPECGIKVRNVTHKLQ